MIYDIVIIGGGPAGLTAAVYGRRQNKTVLVIEKNAFGGQAVFSPKIENIPGFIEMSGADYADKLFDQASHQGAEFAVEEVLSIDDSGEIKKVVTDYSEYECKSIVIATGAKHRLLGVDGEEKFIGNGISFCAVCDGAFYRNKRVVMIGGGNSALVEAVLLADLCSELIIVQNLATLTAEEKLVNDILSRRNVKVVYNSVVKEIIGDNDFKGIRILNTENGEEGIINADGMFIAIGLIPDTAVFTDMVNCDNRGYIVSDENCLTDKNGVFVAGDCRTKRIRQITTACADGAVAALAACKYIDG